MEEARFSYNVRFSLDGFDSQVTIRSDSSWKECLEEASQFLWALKSRGAVPERRWENHRGAAKPEKKEKQPERRLCPVCHQDDQLELIAFQKNGHALSKYKCQRCSKWLPDRLQPSKEELEQQAQEDLKLWD